MDFISGQTLDRWTLAVNGKPEALKIRVQVAQQLAEAMLVAHKTAYVDQVGFEVHGILHGDLKPTNVIVSSGGVPVVLDFLLVDVQRLLDPQVIPALRPYEQKDRTGIFGTPGFMAPEQSEQGNVTVSTDIYGLGITLCHLFLPSQTSPEIAVKLDSNLPEFITKLLIDMTAAESDSRPKSMDEVVQRLSFQPQAKKIQKWFTTLFEGAKGRT